MGNEFSYFIRKIFEPIREGGKDSMEDNSYRGPANILTKIYAKPSFVSGLASFFTLSSSDHVA